MVTLRRSENLNVGFPTSAKLKRKDGRGEGEWIDTEEAAETETATGVE